MGLLPPPEAGYPSPPGRSVTAIDGLATALGDVVPRKRGGAKRNLLIGTWNIAAFGGLTAKWSTADGDSPKRNLTDLCCIAEIVSRFDVCAIQETRRELTALRALIGVLGDRYGFIVSDVTEGDPGNDERLLYVYDRKRVEPSGLVGEIVIPDDELGVDPERLDRQFARTPYAVSFRAGEDAFTLVTVHAIFGEGAQQDLRPKELGAFAEWLAERAKEPDEFNRNLIALGDFNVDRFGDENWLALVSTGLGPPRELQDVPRTIFKSGKNKFYDQIAWFGESESALELDYRTAGYVHWTDFVLRNATSNHERKARISDHYPLWAEFGAG